MSIESWRSPDFGPMKRMEKTGTFGRSKSSIRDIPKLPLDSMYEESSLNLSAIENKEEELKANNLYLQQSKQQDPYSSLLLSPPSNNKKTFSRLDESSVVDPLSHVLTESKSSKENIKDLLRKQQNKYDKAFVALQANFKSYQENVEKEIEGLRKEVWELKGLRISECKKFKDSILREVKREVEGFKENLRKNNRESVSTRERLKEIKKNYEKEMEEKVKLVMNRRRRKENKRGSSHNNKVYEELLGENERLKEEIENFWKEFGNK